MSVAPQQFVRKWASKTPGPTPAQRAKVLSIYKQILTIGKRSWEGPPHYKPYIVDEAKKLFRQNKNLKFVEDIDKRIEEANARMELAIHYKNPLPRLYTAWGQTPESVRKAKHMKDVINPVYMTSYIETQEEEL